MPARDIRHGGAHVETVSGAADLHHRIDQLVDDGMALGLKAGDLLSLVSAQIFFRARRSPSMQVFVVGMFQAATRVTPD